MNGDGYADVIVGADLFDNGQTDEAGPSSTSARRRVSPPPPAWTAESNRAGAGFGGAVAGAGDVNGDGFAMSSSAPAPGATDEQQEGRAFVYLGSATGLALTPAWSVEANQIERVLRDRGGLGRRRERRRLLDVIVGADLFDNGRDQRGCCLRLPGLRAGSPRLAPG